MTWVKICGITNVEDALAAADAEADALGFVFYEKSPRKVDVETVRAIVERLPQTVEKVGVFVGNSDWLGILHEAGLTAMQQILTVEGRAEGLQRAVGFRALPQPPRVYASFPVATLLEDENKVRALAADFAHLRQKSDDRPPMPRGNFRHFLFGLRQWTETWRNG